MIGYTYTLNLSYIKEETPRERSKGECFRVGKGETSKDLWLKDRSKVAERESLKVTHGVRPQECPCSEQHISYALVPDTGD